MDQGFGLKNKVSRFSAWGSGFRISKGLGFRHQGLSFDVDIGLIDTLLQYGLQWIS